ncbi:hypothetical protein Droror1_Dr00025944 [Drosera rotundifolia]
MRAFGNCNLSPPVSLSVVFHVFLSHTLPFPLYLHATLSPAILRFRSPSPTLSPLTSPQHRLLLSTLEGSCLTGRDGGDCGGDDSGWRDSWDKFWAGFGIGTPTSCFCCFPYA